jgi:hypothetical protein
MTVGQGVRSGIPSLARPRPWSRDQAPEYGGDSRDSRESIHVFIGALVIFRQLPLGCASGAMILGLVLTGRASSRRSEPLVGPSDPRRSTAPWTNGFMKPCSQSHPGGETSLGALLNHKPLPVVFIRLQVSQRFGALPAFSEAAWRTGDWPMPSPISRRCAAMARANLHSGSGILVDGVYRPNGGLS